MKFLRNAFLTTLVTFGMIAVPTSAQAQYDYGPAYNNAYTPYDTVNRYGYTPYGYGAATANPYNNNSYTPYSAYGGDPYGYGGYDPETSLGTNAWYYDYYDYYDDGYSWDDNALNGYWNDEYSDYWHDGYGLGAY